MHIHNLMATLAILTGSVTVVLAAQTIEEIVINIQKAQDSITNADYDAKNLNIDNGATTYNTIVNNNNFIAATISGYDAALEGTNPLPQDQQSQLIEATTPFSDAVADYYETLANKAQDYISDSERQAVQESVDSLEDTIDNYFKDLEALGATSAQVLETQALNDDEARSELDFNYDDIV